MPYYDNLIDALVPPLAPFRATTLATYTARMVPADLAIVHARKWAAMAERLARIQPKTLQPRLVPEYFIVVGRVQRVAQELRDALDLHPRDLTDAFRWAAGVKLDTEFTSACQIIERELGRYEGNAAHITALLNTLEANMAVLVKAGDAIWSESFTVAAPVAGGFISSSPSQPTAVVVAK